MPTPHAQAQSLAALLCQRLEDACSEVRIAGSIRRGKTEVKDIELVACLLEDMPLRIAESKLNAALMRMLQDGTLAFHLNEKRNPSANGPRYKKFVHAGIAVDLFIAERANFGNTLAIRTGDAAFTEKMVTQRAIGGLMPHNYRQRDGFLWKIRSGVNPALGQFEDGDRIDCPTEDAFFAALGVPTLCPEERNLAGIQKLRDYLAKPSMTLPRTEDDSDLPHWAR